MGFALYYSIAIACVAIAWGERMRCTTTTHIDAGTKEKEEDRGRTFLDSFTSNGWYYNNSGGGGGNQMLGLNSFPVYIIRNLL